jgi:hypothetical protein
MFGAAPLALIFRRTGVGVIALVAVDEIRLCVGRYAAGLVAAGHQERDVISWRMDFGSASAA